MWDILEKNGKELKITTAENRVTSTTMADTIENTVDSGMTFFDISVKAGQIYMALEADIPGERPQHAHCMRLFDKDLVNK